jgi:hypothetical protein
VLVIWNRYGEFEQLADRFEADGGTVLVAENGYLGAAVDGKTGIPKQQVAKGIEPQHYYAIARHGHNGSGTWPEGGPERLAALGLELAPWRTDGRHILVCPNRYFGMKGFIQPQDWDEKTAQRLRKLTGRPVASGRTRATASRSSRSSTTCRTAGRWRCGRRAPGCMPWCAASR